MTLNYVASDIGLSSDSNWIMFSEMAAIQQHFSWKYHFPPVKLVRDAHAMCQYSPNSTHMETTFRIALTDWRVYQNEYSVIVQRVYQFYLLARSLLAGIDILISPQRLT